MKRTNSLDPATIAARINGTLDLASGGVVPPIQPSTTYVRDRNYALVNSSNSYGRDHSDIVRIAEDVLSQLEQA